MTVEIVRRSVSAKTVFPRAYVWMEMNLISGCYGGHLPIYTEVDLDLAWLQYEKYGVKSRLVVLQNVPSPTKGFSSLVVERSTLIRLDQMTVLFYNVQMRATPLNVPTSSCLSEYRKVSEGVIHDSADFAGVYAASTHLAYSKPLSISGTGLRCAPHAHLYRGVDMRQYYQPI